MTNVMACIDGSRAAEAVCDYAAWAALRMQAPLTFLHVLDRAVYSNAVNLSGSIGLGAQEALLEQLATLDEQRSRLALEQGKLMLEAAVERAIADGVQVPMTRQRHGNLVDTLTELENEIRLLVIGKQGEEGDQLGGHLGSHVEQVIRATHRPVLITQESYRDPQRVMLAFDCSATTRKAVEMLAASTLFSGLPCHVVLVGADTDDHRAQMEWAKQTLEQAGHEAVTAIVAGEVEASLREYQVREQIDLMVIGAYGHSRIRQFFVGSTTNNMILNAAVPLLVLR
ncbi:universal stress protein [Alcanivorax sp. 1008]|uniref:universal stress protein n=1 Tax=Alcanivorax sp. 1008 TaxID=2816853 RepID=UPI001DC0F4A6|nr:universal stress protein [Alcanivorax sp. 1008]MCC1497682.1 universal stress protein [Alcanivorax sp. 1008]